MITWKRLREKKGYTLAELLVVIGIMGVLAAISFVAVSHYRKTLKLLEMDKTAQEIYIAAQNHFTQASTGSKFKEDMKKSLAGGSEINLGTKMTAKPADWDDAEYGSWDDVKDDMYYIQYNCSLGSDSDDLLNDSLLRYVLPYGAIDDTIRKDCQYVIEYNAASDAVYAVYYTDSTDEQLFEEAVLQASAGDTNAWQYRNDPSNGATNRSRTAYNSGKVIIGYYGGGSIVLPYSLSLEENTVVVHNGNRLWAEVYCPVNETKIKDAGILLVDVKVTGEVSGAEKVLSFRVGKNPSEFVNNSPVKKSQAITDSEFSAMKLTGFRGFEFVLDDITESGGHFAQIFADADGDEDFIPGEDIRISAESTIADSSTAPKGSNEVVTNSLYSAVEEEAYVTSSNDPVAIKSEYKDKFTTTAKISTFRHLENLDPVISNVKNVSGTFEITQAFLINDITWKSADNKFEYVNDTNQDIYVRSRMRDGHTNGKITDCFSGTYFSAVQGYRGIVTPELSVFNGQDNRIISTYMVGDSSHSGTFPDAGLFRNVPEGFLIKDVVLEDTEVHAKGNAGLFIGNVDKALAASEYSELTAASHIYDLSRTGYAAISDSTIKGHASVNCTNSDTLAPVPDAATFAFNADSGAGLLVGRYSGYGDLQINNVTDISIDREEMKLEAAEEAKLFDGKNVKPAYTEAVYGLNAGGLVGVMSPGEDASITGRLYLGRLTDVKASGGAAGGVIGTVTGSKVASVYGNIENIKTEEHVTGFEKKEGKWVFSPSDDAYHSEYLTGIVGILDKSHPDLTTAMAPTDDSTIESGGAYFYDIADFSRFVPATEADRTLFNTLGMKAANIKVSSDSVAGGFVGKVTGKGAFTNDLVYYRPLDGQTHVDGDSCPQAQANVLTETANGIAGGFVGSTDGTTASYFTNCGSQSIVAAKAAGGSAGGFVGIAGGTVAFSRCYSGGHTVTNEATAGVSRFDKNHYNITSNGTAGGFAGTVSNGISAHSVAEDTGFVFTHCFSTCSVEGAAYGGGFVGNDKSSSYNYSGTYAAGLVKINYDPKSETDSYGGRSVGGFAGNLKCAMNELVINIDPDDQGVIGVSYQSGGTVKIDRAKASYYYYGINKSSDKISAVGNSPYNGGPAEIDSEKVSCPSSSKDGYFIYEAPYDPATSAVRIDTNQVRQAMSVKYHRNAYQMDQTMTFVDKDSKDGTLRAPYIFSTFKESEAGDESAYTLNASDKKYGISVGCLMNSNKVICTAIYSDWQEPRQKSGFVYGYGYRETEAKVNSAGTMLEPILDEPKIVDSKDENGNPISITIRPNKYHWYVVNVTPPSKITGEVQTQVVQDDLIKTAFGDISESGEPIYNMDGRYTLMIIPDSGDEEKSWDSEEDGYSKVIDNNGELHDEFVKLYMKLNPTQDVDENPISKEQLFELAQLFNSCSPVEFNDRICHSYTFTSQVIMEASDQNVSNYGKSWDKAKLNVTYLVNRYDLLQKAWPDLQVLYKKIYGADAELRELWRINTEGTPEYNFKKLFYSFRYYQGYDKDGNKKIFLSLQRAGIPDSSNENEAAMSSDIITTPTGRISSDGKYYFFRFNTRFAASVDIVVGNENTAATTDIWKKTDGNQIKRKDPNLEWGGYFNEKNENPELPSEHPYLIRTAKQMMGVSVDLGGDESSVQRRIYMLPYNYFLQGADIWFGPGNYDSEDSGYSYCAVVQGGAALAEDGMELSGGRNCNPATSYYGSGFWGFYSGAYNGKSDYGEKYMRPYSEIKKDNTNCYKYTVVLNQHPREVHPAMGTTDHVTSGVFMENYGVVEYLRSAGKIDFNGSEKKLDTNPYSELNNNQIAGMTSNNRGIMRYCDSAVDITVKLDPKYKEGFAIGGVAANSARYYPQYVEKAELNNCVFEGNLTVTGTGDEIDVSNSKKLKIGGVLGTMTRNNDGQQMNVSSIITQCVNNGKVRVEAGNGIKAKSLSVGGVVGQCSAPSQDGDQDNLKNPVASVMEDGNGNRPYSYDIGSVIQCKNKQDIYVGTKKIDAFLYVGGVAGSGSYHEGEEEHFKGGRFKDCSTEGEVLIEINNILKPSWKESANYSVFAGGITGSAVSGYSESNRTFITWAEKNDETPQIASPVTLRPYSDDNADYESGVTIGAVAGSIIGNYVEISKAVISEKAKLSLTSKKQINTTGYLAIGGVTGTAEALDGDKDDDNTRKNENFIKNLDLKNSITVKADVWSANKETMIGGVVGRIHYATIDSVKVKPNTEIKISPKELRNGMRGDQSGELYVAGIAGFDGNNANNNMSCIIKSCTYSGHLAVVPGSWVQNKNVYIGGISGRQINSETKGTNNVRDGALLEARIGHVQDSKFYIGGIAGSTKSGGYTYDSMGVDTSIYLYKGGNNKIDDNIKSGVYAGGAVGSAGEDNSDNSGGKFSLENSYVTCNFRNAFAISSNYLENGELMENLEFKEDTDNKVYVGGLVGEKRGGNLKMNKAYVSVRFNNAGGSDSWGTNEAIIMSTDSKSELEGVEFKDCFAVQRTSYKFGDSLSQNGAEFRRSSSCQMAPYFYKYRGAHLDEGESTMYAKFFTTQADSEEYHGSTDTDICYFEYKQSNTFPVLGCVVGLLGDDESFKTMAYEKLRESGGSWSKGKIYPVLTVNGYKEADRNKEIVWPMYVGTTAKQAEKTLDIFSNLFNNLFNKDLKPTASSNSLK